MRAAEAYQNTYAKYFEVNSKPLTFMIGRQYLDENGITVYEISPGNLLPDELCTRTYTYGMLDGDCECLSADEIWGTLAVHPSISPWNDFRIADYINANSGRDIQGNEITLVASILLK